MRREECECGCGCGVRVSVSVSARVVGGEGLGRREGKVLFWCGGINEIVVAVVATACSLTSCPGCDPPRAPPSPQSFQSGAPVVLGKAEEEVKARRRR